MINMQVNKQPLYYALQKSEQVPIYETDENGNVIYDEIDGEMVPRESGKWESRYENPVKFYGNINSGNVGESVARAYGVSTGNYEAVLCMHRGELPINERSLIWYETAPRFKKNGSTVQFILDESGALLDSEDGDKILAEIDDTYYVDPKSADYQVKRVPPCLDEIVYLLGRLDNNGENEDS